MKQLLIIVYMVMATVAVQGQELPPETRQQLENLADVQEQEPEDDALLQQLAYWQRRPLNLNTAGADELQLFPFLSGLQVSQFLLYRARLGLLIDIHELQSIPGWDLETIRQVLPYVTVRVTQDPVSIMQERLQGGRHQILLRTGRLLQRPKGYMNANGRRFGGDANHLLARYQYRHPSGLQWGFTAEKDPGEPLVQKRTSGPDYLSAHLFVQHAGIVKTLALGDFTVNMGQGLVHWQALAFGKGPAVINIKRQSPVLRPHAGAGEVRFLRGAGITLAKGRWEATLVAARQKVHANTGLNDAGQEVISSFSTSGLHRTATELALRKAVVQTVVGGSLQYRNRGFELGLNAMHYHFQWPVQKRDKPYNLFALNGRSFLNLSTDYSYTWRNLHLFGELAANRLGKAAWVQGLLLSVHPRVDLALHTRLLNRGYTSVAGDAFTEATTPANEQGFYTGLQYRLHPALTLSGYADVFRFPWLRYLVDGPSGGKDYLLQATYQPTKRTALYARFRTEQKDRNVRPEESVLNVPVAHQRQNLRFQISHSFDRIWTIRSRAEAVWFRRMHRDATPETGFLWYAELQFRSFEKLDANARLAFFETGSYNSRIYAYESDVLYSYSIPALFGKGTRTYLTLRYKPLSKVSVWGRVGFSLYPGQQTIGTGLMQIQGNRRTDLKFQAVFNL